MQWILLSLVEKAGTYSLSNLTYSSYIIFNKTLLLFSYLNTVVPIIAVKVK